MGNAFLSFSQTEVKLKRIEFDFSKVLDKRKAASLLKKTDVLHKGKDRIELKVDLKKYKVKDIVGFILDAYDVVDLSIHEPKLENIMREIYKENK